ncbi:MAG: DUF2344 domain-containing protein [Chloroflexi bacterium]|nr:DUF2344 domain-containing protein [Chloroflexota bacterium]
MPTSEQRLRIYYSKHGFIRYTSNLDLQMIWERALRRAGITLAYSQGFHPQAKIQQASPLPLGLESEEEIVDIWIDKNHTTNPIRKDELNVFLPQGLVVDTLESVDLAEKSLQQRLLASDYRIYSLASPNHDALKDLYKIIDVSESMPFTKHNGKTYDIKPLILTYDLREDSNDSLYLFLSLSNTPQATTRPDHILQFCQYDPAGTLIIRQKIHFTNHD